jgi:O-antigen ligase
MSTAALIFALACALLTASRGGLFATAIGFLVFLSLLLLRTLGPKGPARGFLFAPVASVVILAALLSLQGSGPLIDRFSDASSAVATRQQLVEPHWRAFLSRPIFGNGLNTYPELNAMAATPDNWRALSYAGAAHNIYVQALEEVGILGFALMTLMLGPPIIKALRRALFGTAGVEWAAALFGASTLLLLHGAVDFELQIPAVGALFGFALGAFTGPAD